MICTSELSVMNHTRNMGSSADENVEVGIIYVQIIVCVLSKIMDTFLKFWQTWDLNLVENLLKVSEDKN